MDDSLYALAAAFVTGELIPTLAALAVAAAREPLTWSVFGVGALAWLRACRPSRRP